MGMTQPTVDVQPASRAHSSDWLYVDSVVIALSCSENTCCVKQPNELTLTCTSPVQTAYTKKQSRTYSGKAGQHDIQYDDEAGNHI